MGGGTDRPLHQDADQSRTANTTLPSADTASGGAGNQQAAGQTSQQSFWVDERAFQNQTSAAGLPHRPRSQEANIDPQSNITARLSAERELSTEGRAGGSGRRAGSDPTVRPGDGLISITTIISPLQLTQYYSA